jgi:hypothetical protein
MASRYLKLVQRRRAAVKEVLDNAAAFFVLCLFHDMTQEHPKTGILRQVPSEVCPGLQTNNWQKCPMFAHVVCSDKSVMQRGIFAACLHNSLIPLCSYNVFALLLQSKLDCAIAKLVK